MNYYEVVTNLLSLISIGIVIPIFYSFVMARFFMLFPNSKLFSRYFESKNFKKFRAIGYWLNLIMSSIYIIILSIIVACCALVAIYYVMKTQPCFSTILSIFAISFLVGIYISLVFGYCFILFPKSHFLSKFDKNKPFFAFFYYVSFAFCFIDLLYLISVMFAITIGIIALPFIMLFNNLQ